MKHSKAHKLVRPLVPLWQSYVGAVLLRVEDSQPGDCARPKPSACTTNALTRLLVGCRLALLAEDVEIRHVTKRNKPATTRSSGQENTRTSKQTAKKVCIQTPQFAKLYPPPRAMRRESYCCLFEFVWGHAVPTCACHLTFLRGNRRCPQPQDRAVRGNQAPPLPAPWVPSLAVAEGRARQADLPARGRGFVSLTKEPRN